MKKLNLFRSGSKFSPIEQVAWFGKSNGDSLIIFTGGVPVDNDLQERNLVSILRGSDVSMLEMDYKILSFKPILKVK